MFFLGKRVVDGTTGTRGGLLLEESTSEGISWDIVVGLPLQFWKMRSSEELEIVAKGLFG